MLAATAQLAGLDAGPELADDGMSPVSVQQLEADPLAMGGNRHPIRLQDAARIDDGQPLLRQRHRRQHSDLTCTLTQSGPATSQRTAVLSRLRISHMHSHK